jgi:hypothetical protein
MEIYKGTTFKRLFLVAFLTIAVLLSLRIIFVMIRELLFVSTPNSWTGYSLTKTVGEGN